MNSYMDKSERLLKMDQLVDREFPELQTTHPFRGSHGFLGRMLAISLALHVICSLILLSPHRGTLKGPSVSFLNLKEIDFPQQPAAPAEKNPLPADASPTDPAAIPPPAEPLSPAEQLRRDVKETLATAETNPALLHERTFGLGLTNGYFSSIAEGESLNRSIKDYYFAMLREINEKWWLRKNDAIVSLRGAIVEIVVARDGTIVRKTLLRSSGNSQFDRAIFETLEKANPLPPLPREYNNSYFSAPLRFVAPLNLFAS
jgi:protein TonB